MVTLELTPLGVNPYDIPGSDGVPRILERCMDTPEAVARVIQSVMQMRGLTDKAVIEKSGVSQMPFQKLRDHGTGTVADLFAVLDAIGVEAVTIPHPSQLAGEEA